MSIKTHHLPKYRRRQAAISLASFSSKKGHDRALQEYKKRKETKFLQNASLLREYKKTMKQEGYDVGRGASRKRDNDEMGIAKGGKKRYNDDNDNDEEEYDDDDLKTRKRKKHKSDPLHNAKLQAQKLKAEKQEAISKKQQHKETEQKKQHHRKVRAKKMMQRTKKGQPVMKNVISDLLGKIKEDM